MDPTRFRVLTFDCYGTLIDWETGIVETLRPVLAAHGESLSDERILELYAELEAEAERGPFRPYREVLRRVVEGFGARLGFGPTEEEAGSLAEALPEWPPFPDAHEALAELARSHRVVVVSNVDDDLFAGTERRLGMRFDAVVTAQQVGAYKPDPAVFLAAVETVRRQLGEPPERILHVAQSLYHDVGPAREVGLATAWVDRRGDRPGPGATPTARAEPDIVVPDLAALAERLPSRSMDG